MNVGVVIRVPESRDIDLVGRLIAGRRWIDWLVSRVRHARCVERVVIESPNDEATALLRERCNGVAEVVTSTSTMSVASMLAETHDAVALCEANQLFVDAEMLDMLADGAWPAGCQRTAAVMTDVPVIELAGGAFIDLFSRDGIECLASGHHPRDLTTWRVPTLPEAPELRLESEGDFAWAKHVMETLGQASMMNAQTAEEAIERSGLGRFGFFDGIGPPPHTVLTVRAFRRPLFERYVRYLRRLPGARIDVLSHVAVAGDTAHLPGVANVIPFETPLLQCERLPMGVLDRLYDLFVLPRFDPTGWGFENLHLVGAAFRAAQTVWVDIRGRSGHVWGTPRGWERASALPDPHERPEHYLRFAVTRLARSRETNLGDVNDRGY
jgi:hypothetical protein